MYYDESTSMNFELLSRPMVYKVVCDGSSTYTISGVRFLNIDSVTINYVETTSYDVTYTISISAGVTQRYVHQVTLASAPTSGSILRINYHVGDEKTYNTWSDLCMVPKSRLSFAPAAAKTEYKEIDGSDVWYDYTDFGRGEASFKPVSGTWEFLYPNEDPSYNWMSVYNKTKEILAGKQVYASYPDTPSWRRKCRLDVNSYSTSDNYSTVKIKYQGDPYEEYITATNEDWAWDTLSFEDDPIHDFTAAQFSGEWVTSGSSKKLTIPWFTWGRRTCMPKFVHTCDLTVEYYWTATPAEAYEGKTQIPRYEVYKSVSLSATQSTSTDIMFRQGQMYLIITAASDATVSDFAIIATEGRL